MTSRLAVAERLAAACPEALGPEILVTGSVGAGLADELSDLELLLLVEAPPEAAVAARWLESSGATDVLAWSDGSGTEAWCVIDGVEVEPYWGPIAEAEREAAALAAGEADRHESLAFAHVLTHSIVLRTRGALPALAGRLSSYPEALRKRLVAAVTTAWLVPSPRIGAARRGDRFPLQWFLQQDAERVLRLIFALNRRWELPRWKWLHVFSAELALAPDRLVERVRGPLLEPDGVAAVRAMHELVRDTLALVPPELDVAAAQAAIDRRLAALRAAG